MPEVTKLRLLWKEAFGDDDSFLNAFFETAYSPDRCRVTVEAGEPVSVLYWFDCYLGEHRYAYLYAVATKASCRGRGLCRSLMEKTQCELREKGYAGVILVPGEKPLFDFYEKLGYRTAAWVAETECTCGKAIPLQPLTAAEYARRRKALLPEGGVVQEAENLRFLTRYACLYGGDGWVLAARKEGNVLFGVELLPETADASGIVTALGCTKGRFRMPGKERPFAMFLPLQEDAPVPQYFGLAFD